ncbi:MAG: YIP1 family protein, partial [Acidobacteriota bacterium]|nr:YIP1 family protein [Acidobacteriota bacterium]
MTEPVIQRPPAPSLTSRAIGVITAPRATFERIVAAPRVGGALALVSVISAVLVGGFLMTEVGQQAWLEQAVAGQEAWGIEVTDEAYANLQKMAPKAPYMSGIPYLFIIPIASVISAGILYAIFNALMGGTATFKQILSVVAHSQIVMALALVVSMPINYM